MNAGAAGDAGDAGAAGAAGDASAAGDDTNNRWIVVKTLALDCCFPKLVDT